MANNFSNFRIVIIACNIGLMFVNEALQLDRSSSQKQTDKMIEDKLGASNLLTKTVAWITGTVAVLLSSFFKKNGFNIALAILAFIFLFKIGEAFLGRMSVIFYKEIGFTKIRYCTCILKVLGGLLL